MRKTIELHKRWKDDPSKGEVFTPEELVCEMLDKIPPSIWENPTSTFLDPCMGKGTFLIDILRRLITIYGYSKEDAMSRIYGYDVRVKYINYLKRGGFVNVFHKDFLSKEFNMKFNVIIGNPPYQDTTADRKKFNQLGNKKLWKMFLAKSSDLVENDGYICMLVPQAVTKSTNFGKPGDAISKMKGVKVLQIDTNQENFFNGIGIKICSITFKKTEEDYQTLVNNNPQNFNQIGFVTANPELQSIALKLLLNDGTVNVTRHTDKIYSQEYLSQLDGIWSTRFGSAKFSFDRDENQTKEIFWKSNNNNSLMNLLKSNLFCFVAWEGFVIVDKRWYHNFWSSLSLKPEVTPSSTLDEIMDIYGLTENEKKIIKSKDYTNVG
jgi:methylase of polypeptide subunit release factors